MKNSLITFRSVTPAQRAERLLQREGYSCNLGRTPKWMQEQGCGYSIRIRHTDATGCVALLQANQIPYQKVYLLRQNGMAEEQML